MHHRARINAFEPVWPLIARRLEARPNMNSSELFDELCLRFPGRYHRNQLGVLTQKVKMWRADAVERGVVIGTLEWRQFKRRSRRRPDPFRDHWQQMIEHLEADPDQTALELLIEFKMRYPDRYSSRHLRTLQRRVKAWRHEKTQHLICDMSDLTQELGVNATLGSELPPSSVSGSASWEPREYKVRASGR